LIPVTVIWLGFGNGSKILLIFLGCMIRHHRRSSTARAPSEQTLVCRAQHGRQRGACCGTWCCERLPELLNGNPHRAAISVILLVSSELIVAREGLGYLIGFLGANGSYDAMYAVVLTGRVPRFAADRATRC